MSEAIVENELTEYQIGLMQHTISGQNRNWFGTDKESKDGKEFAKIVDLGYATAETPPSWMGDEVIYRLTQEGKAVLNANRQQ